MSESRLPLTYRTQPELKCCAICKMGVGIEGGKRTYCMLNAPFGVLNLIMRSTDSPDDDYAPWLVDESGVCDGFVSADDKTTKLSL